MAAFLIIYLALIVLVLRFNKEPKVEKFLSHSRTTTINGVFVLMVFFSHFYSYYINDNLSAFDSIPHKFVSLFGQLMVTTFLFFSGYGIMYSIKNKNKYIDSFLKKRFLPTWVNFAIAVSIFAIVDLFLNITYPLKNYLLAYIGYESIGNSNWYMFMIFALYILTALGFKVFGKKYTKGIIFVMASSIIYIILMRLAKGGGYWCNTILCYPLGMIVYHKKELIEKILSNKRKQILTFACTAIVTVGLHFVLNRIYSDILHLIMSMTFCLLVLVVSRWFYLKSKIFEFFGKYVFWIYILQRIPMIVLAGKIEMHICFIVCLIATVVLAIILDISTNFLFSRTTSSRRVTSKKTKVS